MARAVVASTLLLPLAAAQSCVYIGGSQVCPAYNTSYISTNSYLTSLFPFLSEVTNVTNFDSGLTAYVHGEYVRTKFVDIFGCSNVDLQNTTNYYARYTISFICNAIVQISLDPCQGDFATSEESIVGSPQLCGTPGPNAMNQLRADYTHCGQPSDSITTSCIYGYENEPENCGFQDNLAGFCNLCNTTSTANATDYCCIAGQAETRCANVTLPALGASMGPLYPTSSATSTPTSTSAASGSGNSNTRVLSGGDIAGIVVGSVFGAALILALIIFCCIFARRRSARKQVESTDRPSPVPAASERSAPKASGAFEPLPGSRVARMTALDSSPGDATPAHGTSPRGVGTGAAAGAAAVGAGAGAAGAAAVAAAARDEKSSSEDESSPEYSSPEGHSSSERLSSFQDYYSSDEIHPNDAVAVLWTYEPRAGDEFALERGEMLRVVGIWDDGWATGVRMETSMDDWESSPPQQREPLPSPPQNGDVKAFPLVCVCLPQHWKKTVEGEEGMPASSGSPF